MTEDLIAALFKVFLGLHSDGQDHRFASAHVDHGLRFLEDAAVEPAAKSSAAGYNDITGFFDLPGPFQILFRDILAVIKDFAYCMSDIV